MSDENNNQTEQTEEVEPQETEAEEVPPSPKRRYFTRRNAGIAFGLIAILAVLTAVVVVVFYRYGVFDNYLKEQFVARMERIGIVFTADVFRVTVAPLKLELENATFNNRVTGEKLFFIRDADLFLTVQDLYVWQLNRDITVDTTDIDGAEVWIRFDENGRSNYADLNLVEEEGRINFRYSSVKFNLKNGLVHFGDVQRKIEADAKNILFFFEPVDYTVPDEQKRYQFDFTSTDSNFIYEDRRLEPIDVRAQGIADQNGTEITALRLTSPIGESTLRGSTTGWESPRYNFQIESTVDLTQTSTIFPLGTPLRGVGNFRGTVSGQGETYRVEGEVTSEALQASNVYLRGLNVTATVEGRDSIYEANGRAIAQLLTFEDFRIEFPQIVGIVRGTGTDFRWVGELQAAAARTPIGTIGGLFISDAVAEYRDEQFGSTLGNTRARFFTSDDIDARNLQAANLKINRRGEVTTASSSAVRAERFSTKGLDLQGATANNLRLRDVPARLDIDADRITSQAAEIGDLRLRSLTAEDARYRKEGSTMNFNADTLTAAQVDAGGARVGDLVANNFEVRDVPRETYVFSDRLRVARIETDAAILGTLNIAGVRLTIRQGVVEGTTDDFDAGTVTLVANSALPQGGTLENVRVSKPVFVLEPAGRYRASADMSLGGGVLGSINLGAATASVVATSERLDLNNLTAQVMDGSLDGNATIAYSSRSQSQVNVDFAGLDLAKLLALQGGRLIPVEGEATGRVNLTFAGTNFRTASGAVEADIAASAGTADRGFVPVSGRVELTGTNGLFHVDVARLNTAATEFTATGNVDLNGYSSNLNVALNSTDAGEIERIIKVLNISPAFERQIDQYNAEFAGNLIFNGTLTGNLADPTIEGRAALDALLLRGRLLGSLRTNLFISPVGTELRDGVLQEPDGGTLAFNINIPSVGTNNISVQATLDRINAGNIFAALPISFPETIRGIEADTSGTLSLTGLPNQMQGEANLTATKGRLEGESFDNLVARVTFAGNLIDIERFEAQFGDGTLRANGTYRTDTTAFDLDIEGKNIEFARIRPFITDDARLRNIRGLVNLSARAVGQTSDTRTLDVNFSGTGTGVTVNNNPVGDVTFSGRTENQRLNAELTANLEGQQQTLRAEVRFYDERLPFTLETNFNNTDLSPFISLYYEPGDIVIRGRATGRLFLEGNLADLSTDPNLRGSAEFSHLALQIGETPLIATEPVSIQFNSAEVTFASARFSGGGSNLVVSGTKALRDNGINNLTIDGRINLSILNAISANTFFAGLADVNIRLTGPNQTARLNGTAQMQNASLAAFIGTERISFERIQGRIIFTSNQAQIENLRGFLGGGPFTASGGALLDDKLNLEAFRLALQGSNVTVPLPKDFITTGDADIEVSGRRIDGGLNTFIAGRINAKRSLYSRNIDLADVIGGRRDPGLTQTDGPSALGNVNLDLIIEGRDALVVRNNLADLTASFSLRVTGDLDFPQVAGRVMANSGTIFFRDNRYEVQRGELVFPPNTSGIEPIINLQAETEVAGYQILVNLSGRLSETENLQATVRSNPALPQADIVSLITTGGLANTDAGIPTLAQTGLNTVAEVLTDEIINKPLAKATDRLFGLNRFQLDPIISGQRLNPTARLTVGRQINRNLLVTYSTNLSEDQNQVLAFEYRVSNRLSFVAQYEQRSLSNVTRNKDNFSFEIRLRKRF